MYWITSGIESPSKLEVIVARMKKTNDHAEPTLKKRRKQLTMKHSALNSTDGVLQQLHQSLYVCIVRSVTVHTQRSIECC